MKDYLTAQEVVEALGISLQTLLRWRKAKIIKAEKFGGYILHFDPKEVKRVAKEKGIEIRA